MQTADIGLRGLNKTRIEALTDGVFAIAMTLLIFGIKLPDASPEVSETDLREKVLALWPQWLTYVNSFVMLGVYWVGHHNQFHYIRRTDRVLLWINIFLLMCVGTIPFSTSLMGRYPMHQTSIVAYGGSLVLVGVILYFHWQYATDGCRLVDRDIDPDLVRMAKGRILVGALGGLLAIALSFVWTPMSLLLYALIAASYLLPGRIDRHWMR